jgi:hypothetical protein
MEYDKDEHEIECYSPKESALVQLKQLSDYCIVRRPHRCLECDVLLPPTCVTCATCKLAYYCGAKCHDANKEQHKKHCDSRSDIESCKASARNFFRGRLFDHIMVWVNCRRRCAVWTVYLDSCSSYNVALVMRDRKDDVATLSTPTAICTGLVSNISLERGRTVPALYVNVLPRASNLCFPSPCEECMMVEIIQRIGTHTIVYKFNCVHTDESTHRLGKLYFNRSLPASC